MKKSSPLSPFLILLTLALLVLGAGCSRKSDDEGPPDTSTYRPLPTPATEFEQKLKEVRDGHFQYVWVFTRLDGQPFTPEDSKILHTNLPRVVDWVGMEDKTRFISGSNFPVDAELLTALQRRYKIEDYSVK
jgi:hypothetical protein